MVEFSLVIILLVFVFMGVFDFGRAIYYFTVLNNTVQEAARASIICGADVPTNCSSNDSAAKTKALGTIVGVPIRSSDITISPTTRQYGDTVTVTGTVTYNAITPFISRIIGNGGSITMNARTQMIVQ